ncbi:MAG: endonuclease III [Blastocatellia bacterium]|nr:endonuclease III [Blastocatellia bacterium]MBL8192262.1 endonuclease III [Blastocatellia bacterium]MBN8722927.1 endonuclease III [Acidobacteriota bacterium]
MPKKKQNFLFSPQYTDQKNVTELIFRLKKLYPEAKCSLNYNTNFELLVATILSAQCTDERVNKVTAMLFRKYRTVADYANSELSELEQDVHSTGFYRNKAKNIQATAIRILEHYNGQVPEIMEDLLTLPGVAIKTANVVLGTGFGKAEGVVVDTHVRRISQRLGLTNKEDPRKIELELKNIIPAQDWIEFSHLLIYHGRQTCKAINPQCQACALSDLCPSSKLISK